MESDEGTFTPNGLLFSGKSSKKRITKARKDNGLHASYSLREWIHKSDFVLLSVDFPVHQASVKRSLSKEFLLVVDPCGQGRQMYLTVQSLDKISIHL